MRKLKFGIGGRNFPMPWKVEKVVTSIKAILLVVSGHQYVSDNSKLAFWLLVGGAVVDQVSKYFYEE
jgi:hypothetical protein